MITEQSDQINMNAKIVVLFALVGVALAGNLNLRPVTNNFKFSGRTVNFYTVLEKD